MTLKGSALLALCISLAAGAASARTVVAQEDVRLVGMAPKRLLLQPPAGSAEPFYMGDVIRPLTVYLPESRPSYLGEPGAAGGEMATARLFELGSDSDREDLLQSPRLAASERYDMRRRMPGHGRFRVHLDDDHSGHNEGGGVTPVPLPGSFPLLLAGLLGLGAALRRRVS